MKKVDTSLIVRLCLPQFAVGLFTTMLNNYLIYFYQPSKESGIPNLIPHNALIPELIQDGPLRVNAYTVSSFFFVTGSALGYVSPLIVSMFKNSGFETLVAWRITFGIYTVIGIILLLIPAYTIKEKDYVHSVIPNVTLGESLKHAFSNKHFRLVTLGQLLENTGMAFFQACIMYYVTSLMGLAETYSVLILAISIAGSLLMYPFVNKFAKKKGKKLPIILGCLVFSGAEIVICFSDMIPGNRLVLACVFALFVSFPFAVLNVLPSAMMADIIQYDTVTTGINQEGIFGAARSFVVKMGNSLAIMIVPSLVVTGAAAGENVGVLGLKLTAVAGSLFCILTIFGDDAYLYKLNGKDETKNVMMMSHHDVVEAEGNWQEEPFGGVIKEGKLWGRGTVDTKTPLFAEFTAVEELLQDGFEFPVNTYIFSSHNEETGGDGAVLALEYFEKNNICFDWIIDEGGAVIEPPMAGIDRKCAMMAVHEKGRCTAKLLAENKQGHAGLAGAHKTPVMRMASFMAEVDEKKPFIRRIHPEVKGMFEAMAPYMSFPMKFVFSNLWLFSPLLIKLMPKLNGAAGEMLGTGCTFRKISTDKDGTCRGEALLRCINDRDFEKDLDAMREIAAKYEVEIIISDSDNEYCRPASLTSDGYKYIKTIIEKIFDYAAAVPFILPAGTDARRFSYLSDAVIRFVPIDIDNQQYASVHGENENISIDKIYLAVDFYKELIKNYR